MNIITNNKAAIIAFAGAVGVFLDAIGVHPENVDTILGQISATVSVAILAINEFVGSNES